MTPTRDGVPVTELPDWHEHPECDGLRHWHGAGRHPHTHQPVRAWGPAIAKQSTSEDRDA